MVEGVRVEENNQSSNNFIRPVIIPLVMFIVILIVPSYLHIGSFLEISSLTWIFRMRPGEPTQLFLAFEPVTFFNSFLRFLLVFMIYRFYSNATTLKRAMLVGILIEIFIFVGINGGNLLYTIFPVPGLHSSSLSDFPLPIAVLIFLLIAKLIPPLKDDQDSSNEWLETNDSDA